MSVNDAPRIIIDNSRVMLHIVASLTGHSRGTVTGSTYTETGNDVTKLEIF